MDQLKSALPQGLGITKIHHVAVIVRDIEQALGLYRDKLGLNVDAVMDMEYDHVIIGFLPVGEVKIELVAPTDDTTGSARFLESKGEGFHHVCFEVPDIQAALDQLSADGLTLIDKAARKGGEGPVAFVHPKSCHGVLVELIEAPGGPAWSKLGY
jgi:methylmalonyl-CoA epimerase